MKIATWNVNSLKVRLGHVLDWLAAEKPDVLALQETKTVDESFPGGGVVDLHGETPADLHVLAGWGGVYHHDGGAWTMVDTGARTGLEAIWAAGDEGVLVVDRETLE